MEGYFTSTTELPEHQKRTFLQRKHARCVPPQVDKAQEGTGMNPRDQRAQV